MKTSITKEEQKMLDELREKALTVLDYMQRNGMMDFHRVALNICTDFKGKPHIGVTVITKTGEEYRSASLSQFQYSDMEWSTYITEWRDKEE